MTTLRKLPTHRPTIPDSIAITEKSNGSFNAIIGNIDSKKAPDTHKGIECHSSRPNYLLADQVPATISNTQV